MIIIRCHQEIKPKCLFSCTEGKDCAVFNEDGRSIVYKSAKDEVKIIILLHLVTFPL